MRGRVSLFLNGDPLRLVILPARGPHFQRFSILVQSGWMGVKGRTNGHAKEFIQSLRFLSLLVVLKSFHHGWRLETGSVSTLLE